MGAPSLSNDGTTIRQADRASRDVELGSLYAGARSGPGARRSFSWFKIIVSRDLERNFSLGSKSPLAMLSRVRDDCQGIQTKHAVIHPGLPHLYPRIARCVV